MASDTRMYESRKDFELVAYANLTYLKQSALELFARMRSDRNRRIPLPLVQNRSGLRKDVREGRSSAQVSQQVTH